MEYNLLPKIWPDNDDSLQEELGWTDAELKNFCSKTEKRKKLKEKEGDLLEMLNLE